MAEHWECPRCGRRFANRNQWHSCGDPPLDEILAGHSDLAVSIFDAIHEALAECGQFRLHPQKTRISFIAEMTFAGVRLARRWVDLDLIVERAIDDARIRRIDLYGPTSFGHEVRIGGVEEVDVDVGEWLCRSLRRGQRETLDPRARVEPLAGRPLEVLRVPLRTTIDRHGEGLAARVPRYACGAFDDHRDVVARIAGVRHRGRIEPARDGGHLVIEGGYRPFGLGEGDAIDVHLTADL